MFVYGITVVVKCWATQIINKDRNGYRDGVWLKILREKVLNYEDNNEYQADTKNIIYN